MSTPERAGWYDDPEDDSQLRYFDGIVWSDRTVPRQAPQRQSAPDPAGPTVPRSAAGTDVYGRPVGDPPQPGQGPHQPGQAPHQQSGWGAPQQPQQQGWNQQGWGAQQQGWGGQQGWQQPYPVEPTTQDGQPLAAYSARVGAYLIDFVIVGLLNLLLGGWAWWLYIADYMSFVQQGTSDPATFETPSFTEIISLLDYRYFFIGLGIALVIDAIYQVGFLVARGATPGKMMVGISVRRADAPGRLGFGVAFMRTVLPLGLKLLWALTGLLHLIGRTIDLLYPLMDKRQQALHDKIAGTQVVRGKQARGSKVEEPRP